MLSKAKNVLSDNNHRLVIINNNYITTSNERGVKALLDLLDGETDISGAYAADKVVGKAAAMIYVLLGIKALYASVISEGAKAIIENHGIFLEYDEAVPCIINRQGDGVCPMELAVGDEKDPEKAVEKVKIKLLQLSGE